jgi:hypothetical protein
MTPATAADTSAIRAAFESRYSDVVHHLAREADETVLAAALGVADPFSGLALVLENASVLSAPRDPLAAARARGVDARENLLRRAGGVLRLGDVARRLGVTPQAVSGRRGRGTILAVPLPSGEMVYPACQFTDEGPTLPGLSRFLAAFGVESPWTRLAVLLAPAARHGGRSALDLLRAGEVDPACAIAATYGEQG